MILKLVLIASFAVQSTELRPRGSLGVMGDPQRNENGVTIQQVAPNSSASDMGIRSNDIISKFNGQKVQSFGDLIAVLSSLRAGDQLTATIVRGEKIIDVKGTLKPAPQDRSDEFNVIHSSVELGKDTLRSIIYTPKKLVKGKKYPALYFIQGYTCDSVEWGRAPNLTIRQALESVVSAGYVVYRIEKFGVGDSSGPTQCGQVDFTTELSGFEAGMKQLKSLKYVDANNVHIFGHSLGGLYAPVLATKSPVASVVAYGSVVKPWYDYMLDIYAEQTVIFGTDPKEAQANRNRVQPLLHALLNTDRTMDSIRKDKAFSDALASNQVPLDGDSLFQRHYTFFRDLNQNYDFQKIWSKVNTPSLAIHGEYDIQAINDNWTHDILNSVNTNGKTLAERVILEKTEHSIVKFSSMDELLAAMRNRTLNPANPGENYSKGIEEILLNWLKRHSS